MISIDAKARAGWRSRGLQVLSWAALAAVVLVSAPVQAEEDPFAALPGSWSGDGSIAMSNGTKERIRCQATYKATAPNTVDLQLSCNSDSYKFELQSQTVANGQTISGNWSERTRGVGGQLSGRASAGRLNLRAEGQTFSALLDVSTRGNTQAVSIRSPGSEMSEVKISLNKRR